VRWVKKNDVCVCFVWPTFDSVSWIAYENHIIIILYLHSYDVKLFKDVLLICTFIKYFIYYFIYFMSTLGPGTRVNKISRVEKKAITSSCQEQCRIDLVGKEVQDLDF